MEAPLGEPSGAPEPPTMNSVFVTLAVPFFFILIGVELAVARARRRRVYRTGDAVGDIGCGMLQQVLLVFLKGATLVLYALLYERYRLVTWRSEALVWVVAFFGVDLCYYWWHRLSHEVNLLWAAHVVHHQSEDYNLAVALRQSILTSFTAVPFYAPLALVGVPVLVFSSMYALSTLYQFWIHTELVGKLGWLEEWLNTPSHHRVHHAINPRYLDKNYGAVLIVWDRIFGTFVREEEPPVYGVVKPLASFNPIWAQVQPLVVLAAAVRTAPRPLDKIRVWFASPSWCPEGVPPYPGVEDGSYLARPKYDPVAPPAVRAYVLVQFGLALVITAVVMATQSFAPRPALAAGTVLVLVTIGAGAGLLEGRRWARPLEAARLVACVGVVALAVANQSWLVTSG
jgi:sterol desaturase/sphingolipid hydroxylase (fatty acid hydroxylase superfamily)